MIPFARTLNGRTGHTSPVNVAGWPGSRTYRRACSATQWFEPHLSGIIEIALWRSVLSAVSMLGPLMSHELRYCYPLPTGCYEIDPKLFPPTPSGSGGVQAFTALRKFITITVQRFLRRKKIKACGERKPLSDFTVAVEQALKWLTGAKQLKLRIRIIFFHCDRPKLSQEILQG